MAGPYKSFADYNAAVQAADAAATNNALGITAANAGYGLARGRDPGTVFGDAAFGGLNAIAGRAAGPLGVATAVAKAAFDADQAGMSPGAKEAAMHDAAGDFAAGTMLGPVGALMGLFGVSPTRSIAGTYNSNFGTRTGGLLGADVAVTPGDMPAGVYGPPSTFTAAITPGKVASMFGATPGKAHWSPSVGWVKSDRNEAVESEFAPVAEAEVHDNPNYVSEEAAATPMIQEAAPVAVAPDTYDSYDFGDIGFSPAFSDNGLSIAAPSMGFGPGGFDAGAIGAADAPGMSAVSDTGSMMSMASGPGDGGLGGLSAMSAAPTTTADTGFSGPAGYGGMEGVSGFGGSGLGGDGGGGGGGGSSGGGVTVICTELRRQGIMPLDIYQADHHFGLQQSDDVKRGYYLWAKPLVRLMRKSSLATAIVALFAMPWAYHMAYLMGARKKDNLFGRMLMNTFKPVCAAIGRHLNQNKEPQNVMG